MVPGLGAAGSLLCAHWGFSWGADAHPVGWGAKSSTWKCCSKPRVSPLELLQIHTKQVGLLCPVGLAFCGCGGFVFSCTRSNGRWLDQNLSPTQNTARADMRGQCCLRAGVRLY